MVIEQSQHIIDEVGKAFKGKDEIIKKVLMTIYAGGNILLEDVPGVGKTTLALAFSKAIGFKFGRVQFTTDTMPSDITGFTMYNRQKEEFEYRPGAADCNFLLADELNRTSPKTQSALLEAMEEKSVTVDGVTHSLPNPFICIATENIYGSAGTQPLPESQVDRFMLSLSIGYPSHDIQKELIRARRYNNPLEDINPVSSVESIKEVQDYLMTIHISDEVLDYIVSLCEDTRDFMYIEHGVSPRAVLALTRMAQAGAVLDGRSYVIPEDVQYIFKDVCSHRLELSMQAQVDGLTAKDVLQLILDKRKPVIDKEGD